MAKKTREQKEQIVADLAENLKTSGSFVISNYHGLSVSQMQELKRELQSVGAEFTIAKNTLLNLGSKKSGQDVDAESLEGPTAIMFAKADPIEPIKKLVEFIKKWQLPKIKSGAFEGQVITKEKILAISTIPGRQDLYAKVVGSLNSPIYGFVSVLNANLRNLVYVLFEIQKTKGGAN